ncbi:MAG: FHA domain-containing protein [Deltaproteobacteria bacterium]|nr:FHA domain-containing protein [Deltaproteobacteria bacterium]MBN2673110.1 FHA domain-containing protein [Deltaproteobacteria bacterium]
MYKIVICDDEGKTTIIPFSRREYSIGRKEGNAIRLTDRNISRRHAILSKDDVSFYIEDLGSRNGVRVDSEPIGKGRKEVNLEERILIGDYRVSVSEKEYSSIPWGKQVDPRVDKTVGKVTPYARLVMVEGPHLGQELALEEELYIVGRGDRANMYIDDPSISRAHARLEGADDHWVVSDLDSSNGLYINGNKRDDYLLRAGDIVEFGNTHFRYVAPGEPYDYEYASLEQYQKENHTRSRAIGFTGIGIILMLLLVTWIALKFFIVNNADDTEVTRRLQIYNQTLADGEQQMKEKNWAQAAKLFAEAQGMGFGTTKSKELKKQATMELEAKTSVEAAKAAMAEEDWALAVNELSKVQEESSYFDQSLAVKAADKLCEELLYKVEFMVTSGDRGATTVLSAVDNIPYASAECLRKRDKIKSTLP